LNGFSDEHGAARVYYGLKEERYESLSRLSKTHHELLSDIKKLEINKGTIASARRTLTSKGWDRIDVDKALWQLGHKDRANKYLHSRIRVVAVAVLIIGGIAAIVGGSFYVDHYYRKNGITPESSENKTADIGSMGGTISSDAAGIEFKFPNTWELKSKPDGTPGEYMWQIEPLSNRASRESLAQKYQQQTSAGTLDTSSLALLAGSGPDKIYAMTITVYKSPEFTIEPDLETWRQNILKSQTADGFTLDGFEKVTVNGKEAYKFVSHISLAQISLATQEYIFLVGDRRVELTILPAKSDRINEINQIINSLKIL